MNKSDLVLVTGAGGFIGGHLVAELRRRGHQRIRAVDIKPTTKWRHTYEWIRQQMTAPAARPRHLLV